MENGSGVFVEFLCHILRGKDEYFFAIQIITVKRHSSVVHRHSHHQRYVSMVMFAHCQYNCYISSNMFTSKFESCKLIFVYIDLKNRKFDKIADESIAYGQRRRLMVHNLPFQFRSLHRPKLAQMLPSQWPPMMNDSDRNENICHGLLPMRSVRLQSTQPNVLHQETVESDLERFHPIV